MITARKPLAPLLAAVLATGLFASVPALGQSCDRPPPPNPEKPTTMLPLDTETPRPV